MTNEEIDNLVDEIVNLTYEQLVYEVTEGHIRLYGAKSVLTVPRWSDLQLRWYALHYRAHEGMDAEGRQAVNRELDAAGLNWPYAPGTTEVQRLKHRLAGVTAR